MILQPFFLTSNRVPVYVPSVKPILDSVPVIPHRVQLSRKKGFKIPPNTVVVARPSKWGNPFKAGPGETNYYAVSCFNDMLREGRTPPFALSNIREELAGKNLACWCKIGEPCHADRLLEIANA